MALREQREIPAHMRGPKRSDDAHNFENYGMTREEIADYLQKQKELRGSYYLKLIAAE